MNREDELCCVFNKINYFVKNGYSKILGKLSEQEIYDFMKKEYQRNNLSSQEYEFMDTLINIKRVQHHNPKYIRKMSETHERLTKEHNRKYNWEKV